MESKNIDKVLSSKFIFETELTKGQLWEIPAKHPLISKIKNIMSADQNKTTVRDAFIMAYNSTRLESGSTHINFDNYDIVFYTNAAPHRPRKQFKYDELDLACYKWGFIVRTYNLDPSQGGGLKLILTITPVVKKQDTLPPIGNEEMKKKQETIIDEMVELGLFDRSTHPDPDLVKNVVKLRHSDFFVFQTVFGVCDPQHDFRDGWRKGPIIPNLNGTDNQRNRIIGNDGLKAQFNNQVCNLLDTQYKKLKHEANQFQQNEPVFLDSGTLGRIWSKKNSIEPAIFEELMPEDDGDVDKAMGIYSLAWNRSHENEYTSHINAPSYPKYHEETVFHNTFNDSCKFIMPASAIDGATCGRCGNWKKALQGCPMEIGNINITFMKTLINGSDDTSQSNYVNFSSYMTNATDGVYYFLRIMRKRTFPNGQSKTYTGNYKYKIMDSDNNLDALTVVTVNSELGCYRKDDGTNYIDLMKRNNMLPREPDQPKLREYVNQPTLGEYVYDFAHGSLATGVDDDFDWVHIVRKASCDFLFSLTTFLQNGGYYGNIYSTPYVISPKIAEPGDFNVTVSHGDQAAIALAYSILRNCKNSKKDGVVINVNQGLHQYYATKSDNLRFGNIEGICISSSSELGKRGSRDDESNVKSKKRKGGGGSPFVGPSWARVPRFDAKIDTQFKKIKAFFEGCAQFKYPVILLICYNEVKTDSDTLDNFLKYTVRDLGHFEYEAKTGFVDDEKLKEDIKRLVRAMPQEEEKSPNAYEKIIKTYNAVRSHAEADAEGKTGAEGDGDGSSIGDDSTDTTVPRFADNHTKDIGGSSTRNHRRTQYTNKHKRSSKTTNRATIKHRKSYRKHNRTVKRRKSRRHH
jgi:hypothetical protein